jgi:hypothetical protein
MIAEIDTDGSGTVDFEGIYVVLWSINFTMENFRVHGNDVGRIIEAMTITLKKKKQDSVPTTFN